MEENQTSESVAILPDMSEALTSETEEADDLTTNEHEHEHKHSVATGVTNVTGVSSDVQGVGVPVSLPVGSIIGVANSTNGTTFNVITSDQLQVFFRFHTCSFFSPALVQFFRIFTSNFSFFKLTIENTFFFPLFAISLDIIVIIFAIFFFPLLQRFFVFFTLKFQVQYSSMSMIITMQTKVEKYPRKII